MKKLVNGKVVDVKNMQLFELAAEGLAIQNTTVSSTADGLDGNTNSKTIQMYLEDYDTFFKLLPYPLNAIEQPIKYATLGSYIKGMHPNKTIITWVDNGLNILLDNTSGLAIKFVNRTWSVFYLKKKSNISDNTAIAFYKEYPGYAEYNWILCRILNHQTTSDFYNVFMSDFISACDANQMVLRWELENMLTFSSIPNKMDFKQNKIFNVDNNEEYTLDIYCNGNKEIDDEPTKKISITPFGISSSLEKKRIKTYAFDSYGKLLDDTTSSKCKMNHVKIIGLHNLFLELCAIKSANELPNFPIFYGAITDTTLVFTINKRLFIAKSNRLVNDPVELANGVELYAVEGNKIYFTKSKRINDKVTKDTLYSYSLRDENIRICKMMYTY